ALGVRPDGVVLAARADGNLARGVLSRRVHLQIRRVVARRDHDDYGVCGRRNRVRVFVLDFLVIARLAYELTEYVRLVDCGEAHVDYVSAVVGRGVAVRVVRVCDVLYENPVVADALCVEYAQRYDIRFWSGERYQPVVD